MNVTDQSMGENSLQTRFVTSGIDENGKPYDIKHSLFLEFDNKDSDKIKRGVEYLESGEFDYTHGRSGENGKPHLPRRFFGPRKRRLTFSRPWIISSTQTR